MVKHAVLYSGARSRYGMTLVETIIGVSISAIIMLGVLSIQFLTARTVKEIYGPTQARSQRMQALNTLRFYLANAERNSCEVKNSNHRIEFLDPNQSKTIKSAFEFVPSYDADGNVKKGTLYYYTNAADANTKRFVAKGPIDISFRRGYEDPTNPSVYLGDTSMVTLMVRTSADLAYCNVDNQDGKTVTYLRNPKN